MSDAPLLQVIIAGTSKKTGAKIKKLSHLPASISQISRSTPPLLHPSTKNDVFLITCMLQLTEKMGFMIMPVTASFCWPTRSAVLAATKNERKIPQMKGKKRKYSQTTGTKKTRRVIGLFCVFQP
ncbi:hypothetical protein L6Y87_24215 [Escherichia coli]|nr:hypothetical protein [Escherichia coli]UWB07895.1 hypothetical protein M5T24_25095 [Escherichia coli]